MLVEFKLQNFASFNQQQTFSMLACDTTQSELDNANTMMVEQFGIDRLLKSAAIFGANASGKSNFVRAFVILRAILLRSLGNTETNQLEMVVPFMLKKQEVDTPSEFEISFIVEGVLMRYGIAISQGKIVEEWLFRQTDLEEVALFHRTGQQLEVDLSVFSEAKDFTSTQPDGSVLINKTRENVPFVAVLAQFDGPISSQLIGWIRSVGIVSGLMEAGHQQYTMDLFKNNGTFRQWALNILKSLQIEDVVITEIPVEVNRAGSPQMLFKVDRSGLSVQTQKKVALVKALPSGEKTLVPLEIESDGTQKVIYLLGPLFDVVFNRTILIIDEFDSKFHTLLSKFIIGIFHQGRKDYSGQLLLTTQDTNLLSGKLFRKDQIWFTQKNQAHESELFSLVEYKDLLPSGSEQYDQKYLQGKYGAIPLFDSYQTLEEALNG